MRSRDAEVLGEFVHWNFHEETCSRLTHLGVRRFREGLYGSVASTCASSDGISPAKTSSEPAVPTADAVVPLIKDWRLNHPVNVMDAFAGEGRFPVGVSGDPTQE